MAVERIDTIADKTIINEYYVGAAQRQVAYPGLEQCLSVTGSTTSRVVGTHISPGSSKDDIKEHFQILTSEFGDCNPEWYIAGQVSKHFATAGAVLSSMDQVRKTARKELGKTSDIYLFDTSDLTRTEHWTYGIEIRATLSGGSLKFSFARSGGRPDRPFHNLPGWYFNRI